MSTDKNLADVQPGGRVRPGDHLPPLPPEVDAVRCMIRGEEDMAEACDYYYTGDQMRDYARAALSERIGQDDTLTDAARAAIPFVAYAFSEGVTGAEEAGRAIEAALSAQPSPGGRRFHQVNEVAKHFGMAVTPEEIGEAIASAPSSRFSAEAAATAFANVKPSPGGQDALDCIGRIEEAIEFRVPHDIYAAVHGELAELKVALAARQPVGPKFYTEDGPCWWHDGKAFIVTVDGDNMQLSVMSGVHCEFIGDARPFRVPAQAVDLGAMPDGWRLSKKTTCYQLSHGNDIIGNLVGPDAEENAAIIARVLDSQVVGK